MTDTYRVKIEPMKNGRYCVSVTGPGITLADVSVCETKDECRQWARERVAWVQAREPFEEYELTADEPEPQSVRA